MEILIFHVLEYNTRSDTLFLKVGMLLRWAKCNFHLLFAWCYASVHAAWVTSGFFFGSWFMWDLSSPTKNGTYVPYTREYSLNHSTTREVPAPRLYLHSLADGHSGCFCILANVKNAAVNTEAYVSFQSNVSVFFRYISKKPNLKSMQKPKEILLIQITNNAGNYGDENK